MVSNGPKFGKHIEKSIKIYHNVEVNYGNIFHGMSNDANLFL